MEKINNKYYDLIVSLVKEHRRYLDYEALLEDIVKDVLEHSSPILETVNNQEVIISYLRKIISTSIVTVPKRMNFNTRARHRIISCAKHTENEPSTQALEDVKTQGSKPVEEEILIEDSTSPALEDLQAEKNNNAIAIEDFVPAEEPLLGEELLEVHSEDSDDLFSEKNSENTLENVKTNEEPDLSTAETSYIETMKEDVEDNLDKHITEQKREEVDVDRSLVEKMINGVTQSNFENREVVPDITEFVDELSGTDDLTIEDTTTPEELVSVTDIDDKVTDIDITESTSLITEPTAKDESNKVYNLEEEHSLEESGNIGDFIIDLDTPETGFDIAEIAEEMCVEEVQSVENDVEEIQPDEFSQNEKSEFTSPKYSCFGFEPNVVDDYYFTAEEILSAIKDLSVKNPALKVTEVYTMKYVQQKSVDEISKALGIEDSDVIETLDELIGLVKD